MGEDLPGLRGKEWAGGVMRISLALLGLLLVGCGPTGCEPEASTPPAKYRISTPIGSDKYGTPTYDVFYTDSITNTEGGGIEFTAQDGKHLELHGNFKIEHQ